MFNKTKYFLSVLIFIIIFFSWVSSYQKLIVKVDNSKIEVWTKGKTVKDVLNQLNLTLNKNDFISSSINSSLKDLKFITIKKAHEINLKIGSKTKKVITNGYNVKEVLELQGISLSSLDIVRPELSTRITDGLIIEVIKRKEETIEVYEEIPYDIKYIDDNNLWVGQQRLTTKGKKGLKSIKYLVEYKNGKEINRQIISEKIINKPTAQVVARGSKRIVTREGKSLKIKKTLIMLSTAYTHTGNKTFTDVWPKRGTVAVDPRVIPLGTKLYIDGYGFAKAEDIGSAIKGNKIDLFMDTREEALRWGQRRVRVFILE